MLGYQFRHAALGAAVAVLGLAVAAGAQTAYSWLASSDGDWGQDGNWDQPGYPGQFSSADTATIDVPGPYTVTLDVDLSGGLGALTMNEQLAVLEFGGNTINLSGDLTLRQGMLSGVASGGFLDIAGVTAFGETGFTLTATVEALSSFATQGPLIFAGDGITDICDTDIVHGGASCEWRDSGEVKFDDDSDFDLGTSTFVLSGDARATTNDVRASITFAGTMDKSGGAGISSFTGIQLVNNGTLQVHTGTMLLDTAQISSGGALLTGKWQVFGGSTLDVQGETIDTNAADVLLDGAGSNFTALTSGLATNAAAGVLTLANGATFTTNAGFTQDGLLTLTGAASTFTVRTGSTLSNYDTGTRTLTGGTYNLQGAVQFDGADIANLDSNVTLDGAASAIKDGLGADGLRNLAQINSAGTLAIRNGRNFTTVGDMTVETTGTLSVGAGTTFRVAPGFTLTNFSGGRLSGGNFDIKGKLQFDKAALRVVDTVTTLDGPGSTIVDELDQDAFGALDTVDRAGVLTVKGGRQLTVRQPVTVLGKLIIGPSGLREDSKVSVEGKLDVTEGEANLQGGILEATDAIEIRQAATLSGSGKVNGLVNIAGRTAPGAAAGKAGLLTVSGDYTHLPGSFFDVELGGTDPGAGYDRVAITGDAIFDGGSAGTVRVGLIDGFRPSFGDFFDIMLFEGRTGEFAAFEGLDLGGGISLVPEYLPGILRLTTIPAPTTMGVLALAGLAAAGRRRS